MGFSVGQEIDGLEFVRVLRPTKRSVAYIVRDQVSQRLEYLKLVPEHLNHDNESQQRFLREAKLHASLSHPNIAQFYSVPRLAGELVMTREWIEGESIESRLAAVTMQAPQAVDYLGQALTALQYAHGKGIIHRDITPARLLITESGILKLTGFDLARSPADPRLTGTGVIMASVHYMAPEQVQGLGQAEERSDIYALGVVLFEMVTGKRPYERESDFDVMLAHVDDPVPQARSINEMISPGLDKVIRRALAKDPKERFQTASQFHEALLAEANAELRRSLYVPPAEEPVAVAPPPKPKPEPRTRKLEPVAPPPPANPPPPAPRAATTPSPDPVGMTLPEEAWLQESGDWSRFLGVVLATLSICVLGFLATTILMGN